MSHWWRRLVTLTCAGLAGVLALLPLTLVAAVTERPAFAADDFMVRWQRVEHPVTLGLAERSWLWGPGPNSIGLYETYAESPGGERLVQYFDKSRMEITRPTTAATDLWRVSNGRLPVELMSGRIQTGDQQWFEATRPARIPVVGDPGTTFSTYAEITERGLVEHGTISGSEQCVNQPPLLIVPHEQTRGTSWESTVTTRCTGRPAETHRLRGWVDGEEVLTIEAGRLATLRLRSTRDGEP